MSSPSTFSFSIVSLFPLFSLASNFLFFLFVSFLFYWLHLSNNILYSLIFVSFFLFVLFTFILFLPFLFFYPFLSFVFHCPFSILLSCNYFSFIFPFLLFSFFLHSPAVPTFHIYFYFIKNVLKQYLLCIFMFLPLSSVFQFFKSFIFSDVTL